MWYYICIMSEKPKTQIFDQDAPIQAEPTIDNFSHVQEWQSADAAKRIIETAVPQTNVNQNEATPKNTTETDPKVKKRRSAKLKAGLAGAAMTVGAIAGVAGISSYIHAEKEISDALNTPEETITANEGDTVWGIVGEIPGQENVPRGDAVNKILTNPDNIGIFSDGPELEQGDSVVVPKYIGEKPPTNE
jgi:hypothetical protein